MRVSQFRRGGLGVFTCRSCSRDTRETSTNGTDDICEHCYELASLENGVADGCPVSDYLKEAVWRYKLIASKGGTYRFWTELGDAVLAEINQTSLETDMRKAKKVVKAEAAPTAEKPAAGLFLTEAEMKSIADAAGATAPQAPAQNVAPLTRGDNTRKALDDAVKAKISEELKGNPKANMTELSKKYGVSYGVVQNIKAKLFPAAPRTARAPAPSRKDPTEMGSMGLQLIKGDGVALINNDDIELMQLELRYLRKKVALLEGRKN